MCTALPAYFGPEDGGCSMDVARDHWAGFFDRLSNDHLGDQVEIEVLAEQFGDQIEVRRQPFEALTYDARNDTVIVSAVDPTVRHFVANPTEVDVDTTQPAETVVRVVAPDQTTLVHLYPTPALPR